ncbi:MAG: HipA domain-containing protein [Gammaproteobacteria bacterium]
MKRCPITYEEITDKETYSRRGLHMLSPQLKNLNSLNLSAAEQRMEAIARAGKMSIQGVQTKLSARLNIKDQCFDIVDQYGHYILKPQSEFYPELPENEALTMSLAATIGIEVPTHGLLYSKDGKMTYFIKRFDRTKHKKKYALEDFAQLSNSSRDTKYNSSMEKVADLITQAGFCSFPKIEAVKLLKLTLFNFLVGNEDMHLKNFSLITRGQQTAMSPAYDLLNTTIAQPQTKEELALPLNGRKNNLRRRDFIDYFATEKLKINHAAVSTVLELIYDALPIWQNLIKISFLSEHMKQRYLELLEERSQRLFYL